MKSKVSRDKWAMEAGTQSAYDCVAANGDQGFLVVPTVKSLPAMQETCVQSLG